MMVAIPALVLAAATDPELVNACGPKGEQSWLCSTVYRITGDTHAADVADALSKPIRIVVVLLAAWILVRITRVLTRRPLVRVACPISLSCYRNPCKTWFRPVRHRQHRTPAPGNLNLWLSVHPVFDR